MKGGSSKSIAVLGVVLLLFIIPGCSRDSGTQTAPEKEKTEDRPKKEKKQKELSREKIKLPAPVGFVNDLAGVLEDDFKDGLEERLASFREKKKIDFVFLLVDSTGEKPIKEFSLEAARTWKVGAENGGLLFTVAIRDRKWWIQINKKLEEILTNEEVEDFGEIFLEDFRQMEYQTGLEKAFEKISTTLIEKMKNGEKGEKVILKKVSVKKGQPERAIGAFSVNNPREPRSFDRPFLFRS